MSGNVTPFLDYTTSNDTNLNASTSIQPITDGEQINQATLQRPDENLRQRTEALRAFATDSLFLQNADRSFLIVGPGGVTWPGSTTASQSGIPVITDVLWIIPMLTPGSAQTQPIPPVQSKYGTLHLKRASDSANSILVTSQRRSYAAGDQINVQVVPGASFSCTLQTEVSGAYRRTIKIVATSSTTLGTTITALNGLTPPSPDDTQLVTAALEGGASNSDLLLDTQARQFVAGNYDGEGHTISPANLASFFTSNPGSALAEGDSLCVQFAMLTDTASSGGRRQAIPENSNTTVPAASFFNSRVSPEKLVNALPICKVVNGALVFATGVEIAQGATGASLSRREASSLTYGGGAAWADSTTNPATTVEGQLDKIITDLGSGNGAAKIAYNGGTTWADGTTNPATTVDGQLDKIISDLAASTGGAKVGGAAVGSVLSAGTLNAQIAAIANGWGRKAFDNAWSALQTFDAGVAIPNGQTLALGGNARITHGSRIAWCPLSNATAMVMAGASPGSSMLSSSFGTGSGGAGEWAHYLYGVEPDWSINTVTLFLANTTSATPPASVALVERDISGSYGSGGWNLISTVSPPGASSGNVLFSALSVTNTKPLAVYIDNLSQTASTFAIAYALVTYTRA